MQAWKDFEKALASTSPLTKAWEPSTPEQKAWCAHKIGLLIREGKSRAQAAAIAYSMGEKKFEGD